MCIRDRLGELRQTPAAAPIKALLRRAMPKGKCQSAAWGFVLTVGIGLRTVVNIKVSSEIGVMGSLLAQRSWDRLFIRMLGYALYGLPMAVLVAFQKYAAANVALSLRTALMKSVHAGLGGAPPTTPSTSPPPPGDNVRSYAESTCRRPGAQRPRLRRRARSARQ